MFIRNFKRLFATYQQGFEVSDVAALMFTIENNKPGALQSALQCFFDHRLNLTHIESKPKNALDSAKGYTFIVDIDSPNDQSLSSAISKLREMFTDVTLLGGEQVAWFPRKLEDLNSMPQKILELPSDHPGYGDEGYWSRRSLLQSQGKSTNIYDKIPYFEYTSQETEVWKALYAALTPLLNRVACEDYLRIFKEMEYLKLITERSVPQISDVSDFLQSKTSFMLKPVASLTSQRDFLNCLAFRVFPATVHMRHHSHPYFSMDPDVAHEVIGHAPLLANPSYAEFVQEIGIASLGASDDDIGKLMNLYFYSVEHGLMLSKNGERSIYGARLLSSVDEIYHALSIKPELKHFDPFQACKFKYNRKGLQPVYWFTSEFEEAKVLVRRFAQSMQKSFHAAYDRRTRQIKIDHRVKGTK